MPWIIAVACVGLEAVRLRIERDRLAAGGLDRAKVGRVVRGSAERTARHTDPGLGHLEDPSRARGVRAASTRDEPIGAAYQPAETAGTGAGASTNLASIDASSSGVP